MVLEWGYKDSELGAHTTGPWDLLWIESGVRGEAAMITIVKRLSTE